MEIAILSIIDKIYPVGCFFDTTDDSFNPNTTWGGTWEKITNSTVLMSEGSFYDEDGYLVDVGQVGGTLMHKLTTDEMPTHYHTYSKSNTATAAATGNTGSHKLTISEIPSHRHNIYRTGSTGSPGYGTAYTSSNSGDDGFGTQSVIFTGTSTGWYTPKYINSAIPTISANQSMVAAAIGLTADKIKKGETILGITGTYEGTMSTEEYEQAVNTTEQILGINNTEE